MKKDHIRDYITEVFRFYARRNDETVLDGGQIADISAVEQTIETLEKAGRGEMVKAIRSVYFVQPRRPLRKKEISERVIAFAVALPTDERNVYRWLKTARTLCAYYRGLTIGKEYEKIKKYIGEEK